MQTIEMDLPSHWACALINGDESGIDDDEQASLDAFTDYMVKQYGRCDCLDVNCEGEDFMRYHDAADFGVLACNTSKFTFAIN